MADDQGNRRKLLPQHLGAIFRHVKDSMKKGETEDEVNVDIEIPAHLLKGVWDGSLEGKANSSHEGSPPKRQCVRRSEAVVNPHDDLVGVSGDREDNLEEYCNWTLGQAKSGRRREVVQTANNFALDSFLGIEFSLAAPESHSRFDGQRRGEAWYCATVREQHWKI